MRKRQLYTQIACRNVLVWSGVEAATLQYRVIWVVKVESEEKETHSLICLLFFGNEKIRKIENCDMVYEIKVLTY